MQITIMTPSLTKQVAAIEKECFADPWSLKAFEQELDNPKSTTLVAIDQGKVAGFVNVHLVCNECYINNVAVSQEYRQHGVGSLLIAKLIDTMTERVAAFITLEVRVSNMAAIQLYIKHGFAPVGERKNFYNNPNEDALLMTRYLKKRSSYENSSN